MRTKLTDDEALARLDRIDPQSSTVRDRSATADIRAAVAMRSAAQGMVDSSVHAAREAGVSWVEIGIALGISPQGARQRYT
jgi:hypothetical protein